MLDFLWICNHKWASSAKSKVLLIRHDKRCCRDWNQGYNFMELQIKKVHIKWWLVWPLFFKANWLTHISVCSESQLWILFFPQTFNSFVSIYPATAEIIEVDPQREFLASFFCFTQDNKCSLKGIDQWLQWMQGLPSCCSWKMLYPMVFQLMKASC